MWKRVLERKKEFKRKIHEIALEEEEYTGREYQECIDIAIDKAKSELGISDNEYRQMFA